MRMGGQGSACCRLQMPTVGRLAARNIVGAVSGIQIFGGNPAGILAPALTGYIATATHSFVLALGLTGAILVAGLLSYCFLISRHVELADAGNDSSR